MSGNPPKRLDLTLGVTVTQGVIPDAFYKRLGNWGPQHATSGFGTKHAYLKRGGATFSVYLAISAPFGEIGPADFHETLDIAGYFKGAPFRGPQGDQQGENRFSENGSTFCDPGGSRVFVTAIRLSTGQGAPRGCCQKHPRSFYTQSCSRA